MAIAVDATGVSQNSGTTSVTSINYTGITVGAGLTNGALVAFVTWDIAAISAPSATWNGVAMSLIAGPFVNGTDSCALFGIINPASGNNTLAVSWTTSARVNVCAQSYTGVLQTGGVTTWPNSNSATGTSTSPSVAITSAANNLPLAVMCWNLTAFTSANNTTIFTQTASGPPRSLGQSAAGAASVTFSAVIASASWVYGGVDMVAAVSGAIPNKIVEINQAPNRAAFW